MKGKQFLVWMLLLVCVACSKKREAAEPRVTLVEVMTIRESSSAGERGYSGEVEEAFSTTLSFAVSGNIERILVDEGRRVGKGQLLAELDAANLKSIHAAAASKLAQAEDAYARYGTLHERGSLPEIKWVEAQNALQEAKSLESVARKNLDDTRLYAPMGGVIAGKLAEAGMNVMPGTPVLRLVTLGEVEVRIAVPENEIALTRVGQPARIAVAALGGRAFEGRVSERGVTANPLSHTYDAKIRLANPDGVLLPGMVCDVRLSRADEPARVVIPHDAVRVDSRGDRFVWLAEGDKAARRAVRVGELTADGVVILEGLKAGDRLIVGGGQKVSEGMTISAR